MIDQFLVQSSPAKSDSGKAQDKRIATTAGLAAALPTVIHQARDGLFYVDANVNGERVHFIVDTGASVVVLNARDAERTGVGASSRINVETAAGSSSMQRARIESISIAGQSMKGVSAVIMRDNLKVSLLGQSALGQLDSVAFKGRKLQLN